MRYDALAAPNAAEYHWIIANDLHEYDSISVRTKTARRLTGNMTAGVDHFAGTIHPMPQRVEFVSRHSRCGATRAADRDLDFDRAD